MRWWCSQLYEPWTWTPRPYLGVWIVVATLATLRWRALRRRRAVTDTLGVTTQQRVWFWGGVFALWLASDWPVGALGAGYLASVHMAQYMLYTFVAAPLLLLAAPEWWIRQLLSRLRAYRFVSWVSRPVHGVVITNAVLLATHAPWTVDTLRTTQIGSFTLDVVWMFGGFVLWYPVLSPLAEHRIALPPLRGLYLFLGSIASLVPAGFMTFSSSPLYRSYEIAPRIWLDPIDDQQLAGAVMKVGGLPIVWITILVIWARWATAEQRANQDELKRARSDRTVR
jgi:putative membrane protein